MKTIKLTLFTLSIVSILCSSSCDSTEEIADGKVELFYLEFEQINQGVLTGNGNEPVGFNKGYVIQTEKEWEDIRKKMNAVNLSQGEISIDFEESTVLAYFDELRPNGGYSIEFVKVISAGDVINAKYKSTAPTGPATTIMTQPFHIVKIPKVSKPVKFLPFTE